MRKKKKIIIITLFLVFLMLGVMTTYLYNLKKQGKATAKCVKNINVKNSINRNNVNKIKEIDGLVKIKDIDSSIIEDLKYATENNFTKRKIYPYSICVLQKSTAEKLQRANAEFKSNGYRIKIWDAYRPVYVQKIFWNMVKDNRYVANPANGGSRHNRGTAVDMTLVNDNGVEIDMPSHFDDFSRNAWRNNRNMTKNQRINLDYMTSVMRKYGFNTLQTEWWHFDDVDYKKYPVIDVNIEKFK